MKFSTREQLMIVSPSVILMLIFASPLMQRTMPELLLTGAGCIVSSVALTIKIHARHLGRG